MGNLLHANAKTTPRVGKEIQESKESQRALAKKYNINIKTVKYWKSAGLTEDKCSGQRAFCPILNNKFRHCQITIYNLALAKLLYCFMLKYPKCESESFVKSGFSYGKQRYKCRVCKCFFTRSSVKGYDFETRILAIKMYKEGLGLYDDLQGISWQWQIADGSHTKSPIGLDAVGKSPVDRVKKWDKKTFINGREWYPVINHNNIRKYARYEGILQSHQETIN